MQHQFLICPQLMSDDVLRDILKDVGIFERCIELPDFKLMDKTELVEIFKRVALPLPQRVYHENRLLGKKMQGLRSSRNISIADYDKNINPNVEVTGVYDADTEMSESSTTNRSNRSKSPVRDAKALKRKIRLSNIDQSESHTEDSCSVKRRCEVPSQTDLKKRQKITWP